MADRVQCPECGEEQALKTDGTFRKHGSNGDTCPGSGQPPAPVEEPEVGDFADEEPAEVDPGFTWSLTVQSAAYLDDQAWHLANLRMAAKKAEQAGHTVTAEGGYDGLTENDDGTLTLTYRVPVA